MAQSLKMFDKLNEVLSEISKTQTVVSKCRVNVEGCYLGYYYSGEYEYGACDCRKTCNEWSVLLYREERKVGEECIARRNYV